MSTRAIYTFTDERNTVHVYKHHDGYPKGAGEFIHKACALAWRLPRFEADEFAAAFVAANKDGGGGVRLIGGAQEPWEFASDCEYHYTVTCKAGALYVTADSVSWWDGPGTLEKVFAGTLDAMRAKFPCPWAEKVEAVS